MEHCQIVLCASFVGLQCAHLNEFTRSGICAALSYLISCGTHFLYLFPGIYFDFLPRFKFSGAATLRPLATARRNIFSCISFGHLVRNKTNAFTMEASRKYKWLYSITYGIFCLFNKVIVAYQICPHIPLEKDLHLHLRKFFFWGFYIYHKNCWIIC